MPIWPRFICPSAITICLITLAGNPAAAQYEWLATLDYSNLAINRLGNIPGLTWITQDNSTYDQNNQRFFFQGNATRVPPWNLYTIDAVTGAVIYNVVLPPGNAGGLVFGLQYDNQNNTLYGIYSGNGFYFSSIDPATGNVTNIAPINNFLGYTQSTFDTNEWRHNWIFTIDIPIANFVTINKLHKNK